MPRSLRLAARLWSFAIPGPQHGEEDGIKQIAHVEQRPHLFLVQHAASPPRLGHRLEYEVAKVPKGLSRVGWGHAPPLELDPVHAPLCKQVLPDGLARGRCGDKLDHRGEQLPAVVAGAGAEVFVEGGEPRTSVQRLRRRAGQQFGASAFDQMAKVLDLWDFLLDQRAQVLFLESTVPPGRPERLDPSRVGPVTKRRLIHAQEGSGLAQW